MSASRLRILGGRMARVDPEATAFAHRDKAFMFSVLSVRQGPADAAVNNECPVLSPEWYLPHATLSTHEGEARSREAHPSRTHARLAEVKRRYDPDNLFRLNQNITLAP